MRRYRIEVASQEDVPHLAAIEQAAAEIFPLDIVPQRVRAESVPLEVLTAAQVAGRLWVAVVDDELVGFALAETIDDGALLAEIDVHPAHARQGLGRKLVAAVVSWAKAQRFAAISLTTFRDIPWNAPFYARLGFRTLDASELTPALQRTLAAEEARGLHDRVAMRLDLSGDAS